MAQSDKRTSRDERPPDWRGADEPPPHGSAEPYRNGHDHSMEARAPAGFRQRPHSIDAEQGLLGAILSNNEAYARVSSFLRQEHFFEPVHGRIFAAIKRLVDAGRVADHVTIKEQFDQDQDLRELDGAQYLARIAYAAQTILNAEDYARHLLDLAIRRGVIAVAEAAANRAYDPSEPTTAGQQLEDVRQQLEKLGGEAGATGHHRAFAYLGHDDMADVLPLRAFIVDRWVPVGCLTSLYGSGGTGKSFLALMMAMCVASGRDWLGFPCEKAPVLAVMCEDDADELRRRRNKIARALQITQQDIEDRLMLVPRVGEPNALMEFPGGVATRTPLFERILAEAKRTGARLIILDNAAQLYGGNENDRAQVTAFLNAVAGIGAQTNGSVVLLGHPPKMANVEFSGSTAWDAVTRSRIWFKRADEEEIPGAPERYTLELVKSNYEKRFGVVLEENGNGIVQYVEELVRSKKAKQTSSDKTREAIHSLFVAYRRAVALEEIVTEAIRRGIVADADKGTAAWRDRCRTIRAHIQKHRDTIEERSDGCYAIKP